MTFNYQTAGLQAPGDGHPQLVGTAAKWRRCDSSEVFISTVAPTTNDTWENIGIRNKYWWVQVDVDIDNIITDILGVWLKVGEIEGSPESEAIYISVMGGGGSDDQDAGEVPFTPVGTISATDVQAAIAEVATDAAAAVATITAALSAHEGDATDAHDASAISILDTGGDFTATDVEGALAELFALIGVGGVTQVWEAVTDGEDVFVWEDDDLVHEWRPYP